MSDEIVKEPKQPYSFGTYEKVKIELKPSLYALNFPTGPFPPAPIPFPAGPFPT
jgi:hypothetical protein